MSNRPRLHVPLSAQQKYALRYWSNEPWPLRDHGQFHARDHEDAVNHPGVRLAIARASYMVNGPNRRVRWSIEWWNAKRHSWETIQQGISKYPERGVAP